MSRPDVSPEAVRYAVPSTVPHHRQLPPTEVRTRSTRDGGERPAPSADWWQDAVFYEVYPRSFAGGDGDGVGDLVGLRRRLDYLRWLGVDALWLAPFYPSPMRDFGYDVTDHCEVDPRFGTLDDFDEVLRLAHDAGLRVIVDWVGNHVSVDHPWFVEAASSRHARTRDWFIWADGDEESPPNNWRAAFGDPAWSWHAESASWYLHYFHASQPDLNWANDELREELLATLEFWLDRGVDGFRFDVPHCFGKDPTLADQPEHLLTYRQSMLNDREETAPHLAAIRDRVDRYPGRVTVGEVNLREVGQLRRYVGPRAFDMVFNFPAMRAEWRPDAWRQVIEDAEATFVEGWPTWFLSNHDYSRHRSRLGGRPGLVGACATLLLTLRGTPFLYAGEELGLRDAVVPSELAQDPGGRDPNRAPIPWDAGPGHGWPATPWLPFPPEADERHATSMASEPTSDLHTYRRLLALRRARPALRRGTIDLLAVTDQVLAYRRSFEDEHLAVLVNMTDRPATCDLEGAMGRVAFSTSWGREGATFDGTLGPDEGLVVDINGGGAHVEG